MFLSNWLSGSLPLFILVLLIAVAIDVACRIFYNLYWHPAAKFPGPWYCALSSLPLSIISVLRIEPQWLLSLAKKYHSQPIRIAPSMLFFPKSSALKSIYCESELNQKMSLYGTGILGPPHLFTTLDGDTHRALRKALGGSHWNIGYLKNHWESSIDELIQLFIDRLGENAKRKEKVVLGDRSAWFSADVMTMLSFGEPWGFVKNNRDERGILKSWRQGLDLFGFAGRFKFFQNYITPLPGVGALFLPKTTDAGGMGWLMNQAIIQVQTRKQQTETNAYEGKRDYMQYCLEARINGKPLTDVQRVAHVTLLIQAGADTTGTGIGSTLRFLVSNKEKMKKATAQIEAAEQAGKLSTPVKYEEVREHLPYVVACVKEGLRLNPPATNLFGRVTPKNGAMIDDHYIPAGLDVTSNAYVVHRDTELYGPDAEDFRPERWLQSESPAKLDANSFVFGMGARICLGKDIAIMESYKLVTEVIRRFDMELINEGKFVVAGGVAYNRDFSVAVTRK
ncbi:hypothetical protein DTO169C6_1757 [Paecilomyces variotii]|nr:hypothetical protein DTO169C6_1757 [Paecilomyces variotii]